jgi:hypothetical protein
MLPDSTQAAGAAARRGQLGQENPGPARRASTRHPPQPVKIPLAPVAGLSSLSKAGFNLAPAVVRTKRSPCPLERRSGSESVTSAPAVTSASDRLPGGCLSVTHRRASPSGTISGPKLTSSLPSGLLTSRNNYHGASQARKHQGLHPSRDPRIKHTEDPSWAQGAHNAAAHCEAMCLRPGHINRTTKFVPPHDVGQARPGTAMEMLRDNAPKAEGVNEPAAQMPSAAPHTLRSPMCTCGMAWHGMAWHGAQLLNGARVATRACARRTCAPV